MKDHLCFLTSSSLSLNGLMGFRIVGKLLVPVAVDASLFVSEKRDVRLRHETHSHSWELETSAKSMIRRFCG